MTAARRVRSTSLRRPRRPHWRGRRATRGRAAGAPPGPNDAVRSGDRVLAGRVQEQLARALGEGREPAEVVVAEPLVGAELVGRAAVGRDRLRDGHAQRVGEGDGALVGCRERRRQRPAEVRLRVAGQPEGEVVARAPLKRLGQPRSAVQAVEGAGVGVGRHGHETPVAHPPQLRVGLPYDIVGLAAGSEGQRVVTERPVRIDEARPASRGRQRGSPRRLRERHVQPRHDTELAGLARGVLRGGRDADERRRADLSLGEQRDDDLRRPVLPPEIVGRDHHTPAHRGRSTPDPPRAGRRRLLGPGHGIGERWPCGPGHGTGRGRLRGPGHGIRGSTGPWIRPRGRGVVGRSGFPRGLR